MRGLVGGITPRPSPRCVRGQVSQRGLTRSDHAAIIIQTDIADNLARVFRGLGTTAEFAEAGDDVVLVLVFDGSGVDPLAAISLKDPNAERRNGTPASVVLAGVPLCSAGCGPDGIRTQDPLHEMGHPEAVRSAGKLDGALTFCSVPGCQGGAPRRPGLDGVTGEGLGGRWERADDGGARLG
jgi:hypothetical protein